VTVVPLDLPSLLSLQVGGSSHDPAEFSEVDLFSAGINALNGVLVARNPSHNRGYTVAGLLIMAYFGGIGSGLAVRDHWGSLVPLIALQTVRWSKP
jgi:hypothetical protein